MEHEEFPVATLEDLTVRRDDVKAVLSAIDEDDINYEANALELKELETSIRNIKKQGKK